MLEVKNLEDAKKVSTTHIAKFLDKSVLLFCVSKDNEIEEPLYDEEQVNTTASFKDRVVIKNVLSGNERYYNESNDTSYIPVKSHNRILAIVGIRNFDYNQLSKTNEYGF